MNDVKIITFDKQYKNQVISLILYIQNIENRIDLSLEEQPDLNDIHASYIANGGGFWVALDDNDTVIGTIGLQIKENRCGVLKKLFVEQKYRGREIGLSAQLFEHLLDHAISSNLSTIILDTPASAKRSHSFYKKMGFVEVTLDQLPIPYTFPDRNSYLLLKKLP